MHSSNLTSFPRVYREDDAKWPKKNIVGKQELEIRLGNDHIAFEVGLDLSFCAGV